MNAAGVENDLAVLGISKDDPNAAIWLAQIAPVIEKNDFGVLPENLRAVQVFLAMQTNWRVIAGMAGVVYQGLDYSALATVFWLMKISRKDRDEVFSDLQIMEAAAIPLLNKKSS